MMSSMNMLDIAKCVQALTMLCEGSPMRSISRVGDVSPNRVSKLLEEAGKACEEPEPHTSRPSAPVLITLQWLSEPPAVT
jgi:hypothetical protein